MRTGGGPLSGAPRVKGRRQRCGAVTSGPAAPRRASGLIFGAVMQTSTKVHPDDIAFADELAGLIEGIDAAAATIRQSAKLPADVTMLVSGTSLIVDPGRLELLPGTTHQDLSNAARAAAEISRHLDHLRTMFSALCTHVTFTPHVEVPVTPGPAVITAQVRGNRFVNPNQVDRLVFQLSGVHGRTDTHKALRQHLVRFFWARRASNYLSMRRPEHKRWRVEYTVRWTEPSGMSNSQNSAFIAFANSAEEAREAAPAIVTEQWILDRPGERYRQLLVTGVWPLGNA